MVKQCSFLKTNILHLKIIREQCRIETTKAEEFKEKIKFEEKLVELEQKKTLNNRTNLLAEKEKFCFRKGIT